MRILKKPTYILLLRRTHLAALAVLLLAAAIFAVVYAPGRWPGSCPSTRWSGSIEMLLAELEIYESDTRDAKCLQINAYFLHISYFYKWCFMSSIGNMCIPYLTLFLTLV